MVCYKHKKMKEGKEKMKVKPLMNYRLLGTSVVLDMDKIYEAVPATNVPSYGKNGIVFVEGMLLCDEEYQIVED